MLPVPNGSGTSLGSINLRKHSIELYIYVVKMIRELVVLSRNHHRGLPFASFNIDLYRNKFTKTKYFASRVSFTVANRRHSFNLGIRAFTPTYLQRVEMKASDLLTAWLQDVCGNFQIGMDQDILAMSGDHGSDVARAMREISGGNDEWCISHLLDCTGRDAFGTSVDPAKSKNPRAREVINAVRKTLETVNKSETLGAAFSERSREELGRAVNPKNDAAHRWGSVEEVLKCAIFSFGPMGSAFVTHGKSFPLSDMKQVMLELYSVIHEVRKVQKRSQAMEEFVVVEVYIQLVVLFFGVMQSTQPLLIHDPSRVARLGVPPQDKENRPPEQLDNRTTQVRQKLLQAASTRYFDRYNAFRALRKPAKFYGPRSKVGIFDAERSDFKFSYMFDIVAALWPGMSDGVVLRKLIDAMPISEKLLMKFNLSPNRIWTDESVRDHHFALIHHFLWSSIRSMAMKVAVSLIEERRGKGIILQSSTNKINAIRKRKREANPVEQMNALLGIDGGVNEENDASELDEDDVNDVHSVASKMVDAEIQMFKKIPKSACPKPTEFVTWWAKSDETKNLPCLRIVVSALSGLKVGSGGLECDIGVMVDLVTPKRASLSDGYVEALSFLKLNQEHLPFDPTLVPTLSNSSWKKFMPGNGRVPPFVAQDEDGSLDNPNLVTKEDDSDLSHSESSDGLWVEV